METTRQNKVCRLIQKELSEIFLLQTKAMNGVLVSVSAVRISPDMSIVRAYLSVFPSTRAEEIVKNINGTIITSNKFMNNVPIGLTIRVFSPKIKPAIAPIINEKIKTIVVL